MHVKRWFEAVKFAVLGKAMHQLLFFLMQFVCISFSLSLLTQCGVNVLSPVLCMSAYPLWQIQVLTSVFSLSRYAGRVPSLQVFPKPAGALLVIKVTACHNSPVVPPLHDVYDGKYVCFVN